MSETIKVAFSGPGSGRGGLAWGQQHIWGAMRALGETMNMSAIRELDPGARVDDFVEELRFYAGRYQAMRTRLEFPPDGPPLQVVVDSGEIPLELVDIDPADDPAKAAAELAARQQATDFDYAAQFPIRMTLVRREGVLTHLVTTISHFATDAAGAFAMYNDWAGRDPETGAAREPVRTQPLELAAKQASPAGRRQSETSLRYWEEQLRSIPVRRFRPPVDRGADRYWQLELDSPAMYLAVRTIAHRVGVDASTALLGVYAVALARVTGNNPTVAQMLVSNRFRPGLATMVSNISQTGLFVVDVAGATVDEAVVRANQVAMRTYKHAYFDLADWRELIRRVGGERGGEIELGYYYNDRPSQFRPADPGEQATRSRIEAALPRTGPPRWTRLPYFNERLMVTFNDAPAAIAMLILADTHYVAKEEMEGLARELESLAIAAACDPETLTGVA